MIANGFDVKLYADPDSSRLYITRATLTNDKAASLNHALEHAKLLKQIKNILNQQQDEHNLVFSNNPNGAHITIQLIEESVSLPERPAAQPTVANKPAITSKTKHSSKQPVETNSVLSNGPSVARQFIPKSLVSEDQQEDSGFKRFMLYVSSHFFTGGSWIMFFLICLGMIFSVLVLVRGYMCPDLAVAKDRIPAYCGKIDSKKNADDHDPLKP